MNIAKFEAKADAVRYQSAQGACIQDLLSLISVNLSPLEYCTLLASEVWGAQYWLLDDVQEIRKGLKLILKVTKATLSTLED